MWICKYMYLCEEQYGGQGFLKNQMVEDIMTKKLAQDMFHWSLSLFSKLEQMKVLLAQTEQVLNAQ